MTNTGFGCYDLSHSVLYFLDNQNSNLYAFDIVNQVLTGPVDFGGQLVLIGLLLDLSLCLGFYLNNPMSCVVDDVGNVIVGQLTTIVRINYADFSASAISGQSSTGYVDGSGTVSMFETLRQIAWGNSSQNFIYGADYVNGRIRTVDVTSGFTNSAFQVPFPFGVVVDSMFSHLYVSCFINNGIIYRFTISTSSSVIYAGSRESEYGNICIFLLLIILTLL